LANQNECTYHGDTGFVERRKLLLSFRLRVTYAEIEAREGIGRERRVLGIGTRRNAYLYLEIHHIHC